LIEAHLSLGIAPQTGQLKSSEGLCSAIPIFYRGSTE
jgi:hypothetical protein